MKSSWGTSHNDMVSVGSSLYASISMGATDLNQTGQADSCTGGIYMLSLSRKGSKSLVRMRCDDDRQDEKEMRRERSRQPDRGA